MPAPSGSAQIQEEDGLAWRVSPEVTERLDRIAALGIDDLMDVTSTPDARAAAANAPAEEEDADEEGDHPQTSDATIAAMRDGGVPRRPGAGSDYLEAEEKAEEKAPGGADAPSASASAAAEASDGQTRSRDASDGPEPFGTFEKVSKVPKGSGPSDAPGADPGAG